MKFFKNSISYIFSLSLLWPACGLALELAPKWQLFGYGHLGYLQTDGNQWLRADEHGSWDYNDIALLLVKKLEARSNAWLQIYSFHGKTRVDWMFADYQLKNATVLKLGQIKLPFGFYNDIRDVEYLRPASLKPFIYQDDAEIVPEAFRGLSVEYKSIASEREIGLDMYGGQIVDFEGGEEDYKLLLGARLRYAPGVSGLELMANLYKSGVEAREGAELRSGDSETRSFSVGYNPGAFDSKLEYASKKLFDQKLKTYYWQTAYTLAERWTPFLRYDFISVDDNRSDPSLYQRSLSAGLAYRLNDYWGLRLEQHFNKGYLMAVAADEIEPGSGEEKWRMSAFSVNFIF